MVLMTMIARLHDGLPLAATMQEDEQVGLFSSFTGKILFKKVLVFVEICSFYC